MADALSPAVIGGRPPAAEPYAAGRAAARELSGLDKAALVLLSLERSKAVELLRAFDRGEVEALLGAAHRLRAAGAAELDAAVREFEGHFMSGVNFVGSDDEVSRLVAEAVGDVPAPQAALEEPVWSRLAAMPDEALRDCIAALPEQVAAYVLSMLEPARVAELLRARKPAERNALIERMLQLREISPEIRQIVEDELRRQLLATSARPAPPHARIAGILNQLDAPQSREAVDHLAVTAPEDAAAVRKLLFKFEQLPSLPKEALTMLVDRMPVERMVLALQGTDIAFQGAVLAVMAPRARRIAEAELQGRAVASAREVGAARRAISDAVLALVADGRVTLEEAPSGGGA